MIDAIQLEQFPGAPFAEDVVAAAVDDLRRHCGWHIAPEVTETILVDSDGGQVLMLPTLLLLEVDQVRDMTGDAPSVVTGWKFSRKGMLFRREGWPCGFGAVEVTMKHGYEECPPALLPVLADIAQGRRITQESLGSRSVTYDTSSGGSSTLLHFTIPPLA